MQLYDFTTTFSMGVCCRCSENEMARSCGTVCVCVYASECLCMFRAVCIRVCACMLHVNPWWLSGSHLPCFLRQGLWPGPKASLGWLAGQLAPGVAWLHSPSAGLIRAPSAKQAFCEEARIKLRPWLAPLLSPQPVLFNRLIGCSPRWLLASYIRAPALLNHPEHFLSITLF